ncbi:BAR domain-containing family protein [Lobosporangium transversale]|uniref:BAR domain-containing family protein n=1 Tax=Lobosporangium transversale TaxID=64571 RepID=A0A1Y2H236_9FUNG|nr:BAR domain-containing family protein [Lobosporangium transversale]ORZ27773.1 BAR domain-containing family protein [Lobosporangium transversale]|eukprot:XP_021885476.1 BAR domain-containing family protein [Lobosporangium transversale]
MDQFKAFSQQLNPLAAKLGKQLGQVKQFAQEKMGTAEDITELPQEYKDLEKRVDALRTMHTHLLRVTRTYQNPSYDYPAQLQETLGEFGRTVTDRIQQVALSPAEKAASEAAALEERKEAAPPKTLAHALSRASFEGSELIGLEEPMGSALFKFATVQEKIGEFRLKMDQEITTKFVQPFGTTLNTQLGFAMKARRNVQNARLALDTAKAQYKTARPEKSEASRIEVEQAEDLFVAAVEEATTLMKTVLENPEPLRNLADLVAAQLNFYKEAQEILADVAPEIDELSVTQEALYRNSRSE